MTDYIQVTTTAETQADAQAIARAIVEGRLASCAQVVGPITSTYWWQGKIETTEEWLCIIKTSQDLYAKLEGMILSVHPYQVPEILATPILAGSQSYLEWLGDSLVR
jgi:periplasmic divalent cation tolerance protein